MSTREEARAEALRICARSNDWPDVYLVEDEDNVDGVVAIAFDRVSPGGFTLVTCYPEPDGPVCTAVVSITTALARAVIDPETT